MNVLDVDSCGVRMGMIGGGSGAFIGAIHRAAAALDGRIELVCGALSSTPERAIASAKAIGIPADRSYSTWQQMLAAEAQLPADRRMQFVSIVTPNDSHVPIAIAALKAGFHVMCEKPVAMNLQQAEYLQSVIRSTGKLFAVAHGYTGYPMVKEARELIANGKLGSLRKVIVDYVQGWLSEALADNKQAAWRVDPTRAGLGGCVGDIGTHAANLAEYVTGLKIESVLAELSSMVSGRLLDDDAVVLVRMQNGVKGVINVSQIAAGEENNLTIRVYGEHGGIEWRQQEPNTLLLKWLREPTQIIRAGTRVGSIAAANTRLPAGHPEGLLEAFANLYRNFAASIQAYEAGPLPRSHAADYPGIEAGVRSMAFVAAVVESSSTDAKWTALNTVMHAEIVEDGYASN